MAEGILLIFVGVVLASIAGALAYEGFPIEIFDWETESWKSNTHILRDAIVVAVLAGIGPVAGGVFLIVTS